MTNMDCRKLPASLQRIVDIGYGIDEACIDMTAVALTNPIKTLVLALLFSLEAGMVFASF